MKVTIWTETDDELADETLGDQEADDLLILLDTYRGQLVEQLNDIGNDHPFADPKERDEIRGNLQREVAVIEKVLGVLVFDVEDDEIQEAECPRS